MPVIAQSIDSTRLIATLQRLPVEQAVIYFKEQITVLFEHEDYLLSEPVVHQAVYHIDLLYNFCFDQHVCEHAITDGKPFYQYLVALEPQAFEYLCVLYADVLSRLIVPALQDAHDNVQDKQIMQCAQRHIATFGQVINHLRATTHEQRYVLQLQRYLELQHLVATAHNPPST